MKTLEVRPLIYLFLGLLTASMGFGAQNIDTPKAVTVIEGYPLLERLQKKGIELHEESLEWMKKWKGLNLEDLNTYAFKELSGSTSINLKIQKLDPKDENGHKSRGSFVTRNSSANPNTEVAYFNLAALLGHDELIRPAAPYDLGPKAQAEFKKLILAANIKNKNRLDNKARILKAMDQGGLLYGCVKAKKDDTFDVPAMADSDDAHNGAPRSRHPVIAALQAENAQPSAQASITLKNGYTGNALTLAREYSILMTLDAIFQQWDRYSGGNITIMRDEKGEAHFFSTDNGGADLSKTTGSLERNLHYFSRYDRETIRKLSEILDFLREPQKGFLGYTKAEDFVVDLGLRTELSASEYAARLKRNLEALMKRVQEVEARYGAQAYLP